MAGKDATRSVHGDGPVPKRWEIVKRVFYEALEQDEAARAAYLDRACGGDTPLRAEIDALLSAHQAASGFMEDSTVVHRANDAEGRRIGPYRIVRELGHGGMGTVYLAERDDGAFRKQVAIKLVRAFSASDALVDRFRKEREILAGLDHPNVARLLDAGTTEDGLPYLIMEYVEGERIDRYCETHSLSIPQRLDLFRGVCAAVHFAHQNRIIHRDIKPANVLVTTGGTPKLLDFGIAKLLDPASAARGQTASGFLLTPEYASPEQVRGEAISAASDVYSLGALLYRLLTGRGPYRVTTDSLFDVVQAVREQDPDPPSKADRRLAGDLDNIVLRALRKDPRERYASADELSADVGRHLSGFPVKARTPALAYRAGKFLRRRRGAIAAAILALVPLAVAVSFSMHSKATPANARGVRLAVLPLEDLSGGTDQAYFADGLTEQLISTLSHIDGLRVIARSSVERYRRAPVDLAEAARQLEVASLLQGTVRKQGNRLRISLQLVDPARLENRWSEDYDRTLDDVFAIQTDVAQRVAQVLQLRLAAQGSARAARPTDNLDAFDAYLHGLYFAAGVHGSGSAAALDSAIARFQRAVELDPRFAMAHAMLSIQLGNRFFNYDADRRWEEAAFVEAEKALALDPELGEAHLARANLLWTLPRRFPHEQAVQELKAAIALKPGLSDAHLLLGAIYFHIGLFEKALAELEAARLADPNNGSVLPRVARVHAYQGKLRLALDELERKPGWEPEKAWLLGSLGQFDRAEALLQSVAAAPQSWARTRADLEASHAFVLAGQGRRAEAEQAIARSVAAGNGSSHFHHAAHRIASAYALLGERDKAVEWLERVSNEGMPCYPLFAADPNLKALHGFPRFEALLAKLKEQYDRSARTL